jgi:hypothetical protein
MRTDSLVLSAAAAFASLGSVHLQRAAGQPLAKAPVTCQLVTVDEVAKSSQTGPIEIDRKSSGENPDDGSSSCTWIVKGGGVPVVILTIENADVPDAAEQALGTEPAGGRRQANFSLRKMQTFGDPPPPAAVPGLGDEALYRDFKNGKGGALLIRRGFWIVTFSGSAPRDVYVALGKLVLERL